MKKTIQDYNLNNKRVIIRCDFNVPIKSGIIEDDNRIKESLETINYAIKNNAKVILMSHLGRVKTEEDKKENSLLPVSVRLSELLNKRVKFIPFTHGKELEDAISSMNIQDVLLIENTRYEDIDGKKESGNDEALGKYWSSLGDIYINDAFGTSHRSHASNVGIASNLPSGIGFLIEKEMEAFNKVLNNPERPYTVILGGSKVADKINVIENLVKIADYILIGGGMAFTFLKAKGYNIGKSILDEENIEFCKKMLANKKIILPLDFICSKEISDSSNAYEKNIDDIASDDIGLDIGTKTRELFSTYINQSNTIVWNGTMGVSEYKNFANGTIAICEYLKNNDGTKVVGGGDTAAAVINLGYKAAMTHISTGGGASLELLEGKSLPGIEIINEK
ncbi:MAG: phosphoglycerate kinase [Bacilli bacterium]|nr:phosphoglycerate kinase [Bacilli bacterium]